MLQFKEKTCTFASFSKLPNFPLPNFPLWFLDKEGGDKYR